MREHLPEVYETDRPAVCAPNSMLSVISCKGLRYLTGPARAIALFARHQSSAGTPATGTGASSGSPSPTARSDNLCSDCAGTTASRALPLDLAGALARIAGAHVG